MTGVARGIYIWETLPNGQKRSRQLSRREVREHMLGRLQHLTPKERIDIYGTDFEESSVDET